MTPRVSVLMAVHNGRPTLAESMDSVLGQSWRDFEFVIVDDGSTDGSTEMLQDYAGRDARIRLLRNDARRNLPTSLNLGLRACRAPWIARIDADDVALVDRLAVQLDYLQRHPDVGVLGSSCRHIDAGGRFLGSTRHPDDDARIRLFMAFWCCMVHPTTMFRRDLAERVGGYDTELWTGQDYDFWARLLAHTRMANLPTDLILYRVHDRSITQSPERQAVHFQLTAKVHRGLMSHYLGEELTEVEAMALRGLVMADRIMDDEAIALGLPLLERFVRRVRAREAPDIAVEFARHAAEGLLAQSYYQKSRDSRLRHRLYRTSVRVDPQSLVTAKGARATAGVLLPSLAWRWMQRLRA